MADNRTVEQRSHNMRMVKSKNTTPELIIRRGLHFLGLRYKLHDKKLPGTPDLVFPKFKAILFVHGCFWHQHKCARSRLPATRAIFWKEKLSRNALRDRNNISRLNALGWHVVVVWECAIVGKYRKPHEELLLEIVNAILDQKVPVKEIDGNNPILSAQ